MNEFCIKQVEKIVKKMQKKREKQNYFRLFKHQMNIKIV